MTKMKHKLFILTFLFFLSGMAFGQTTDKNVFNIKIRFDKKIPVDKIDVFYNEEGLKNGFLYVNYRIDKIKNEIELFGENGWIIGGKHVCHFPLIVFSYSEMKKYDNGFNKKEERQTSTFYYLLNEDYTFEKGFDKEILFKRSNERNTPYYIKVDENQNVGYDYGALPSFSSLIKINPL